MHLWGLEQRREPGARGSGTENRLFAAKEDQTDPCANRSTTIQSILVPTSLAILPPSIGHHRIDRSLIDPPELTHTERLFVYLFLHFFPYSFFWRIHDYILEPRI